MADINDLYNVLTSPENKGKYFTETPSLDVFKSRMEDEEYQDKVHKVVVDDGFYSFKDKDRFKNDFVPFKSSINPETGDLTAPESKNAKELNKNILNIDKSVNYETDPTLRNDILSEYFDISRMTRPVDLKQGETPVTFSGVDRPIYGMHSSIKVVGEERGDEINFKNEEEVDLKNHFGEEKYELYKKYKETGTLNIDDIPGTLKDGFDKIFTTKTSQRNST